MSNSLVQDQIELSGARDSGHVTVIYIDSISTINLIKKIVHTGPHQIGHQASDNDGAEPVSVVEMRSRRSLANIVREFSAASHQGSTEILVLRDPRLSPAARTPRGRAAAARDGAAADAVTPAPARRPTTSHGRVCIGELAIDPHSGAVVGLSGNYLFTYTESNLLLQIVRSPSMWVSARTLSNSIGRGCAKRRAATLRVFIHNIRKKLAVEAPSLELLSINRGYGILAGEHQADDAPSSPSAPRAAD